MKKADKTKLLYLMSVSLIFFVFGCVDTNVTNIPESINYESQVSVVNLAADVGTATVKLVTHNNNVVDFGSVGFGNATAYKMIPAGNKTSDISYANGASDKNLKLFTETNYRLRLFLVGDKNNREIVKVLQRYYKSTKADTNLFPPGFAQVKFFNGSPQDTLSSVDAIVSGDTTNTDLSGMVMGDGTSYMKLKPGNYTFNIMVGSGGNQKTLTVTQNLTDQGRYTAVIYDNHSSLKSKIFTDD